MKRSTKSSVVLAIAAAVLALSLATLAAAQNDALASLYLSAANVPTNVAGSSTATPSRPKVSIPWQPPT